MKPGPYVNEEGDLVYLPISDYTLNEARHTAAQFAEEMIGSDGRARYLGKQSVPLHDHDGWEYCNECPDQWVWAFETYEGSWRHG